MGKSRIKEPKSFQRTIRMSERVRFILESYEGNGMNEQFENIILDSNELLPKITKEVEKLELDKKRLLKEISKYKDILSDMNEIKRNVSNAKRIAENFRK